jgi:hypothetical protein
MRTTEQWQAILKTYLTQVNYHGYTRYWLVVQKWVDFMREEYPGEAITPELIILLLQAMHDFEDEKYGA